MIPWFPKSLKEFGTNIFFVLQKLSMYSKIISVSSFFGKPKSEILSENEWKITENSLFHKKYPYKLTVIFFCVTKRTAKISLHRAHSKKELSSKIKCKIKKINKTIY